MQSMLKDNNKLTLPYLACIATILFTALPRLDYFIDWRISIVPVIIIILWIVPSKETMRRLWICGVLVLIFSLFQYEMIYKGRDFVTVFRNEVYAFLPIVIALFLRDKADTSFLKVFLVFLTIVMCVTAITTIIGLNYFPRASRELAGSHETEEAIIYLKMNIGGFEFIYSTILLLPLLFWLVHNVEKAWRWLLSVAIIILIVVIYKSAYTTAFLLMIATLFLVIIERNPKAKPFIIPIFIVFIVLAGTGWISVGIESLSTIVESDYVSDRLSQLAQLIGGTDVSHIQSESNTERIELLSKAWQAFLSSPLWGHNMMEFTDVVSGHSVVLDTLASSGIIGLTLIVFIYSKLFRLVVIKNGEKINFYVLISWGLYFILSTANPSTFYLMGTMLFCGCVCAQRLYVETIR